MIKKILLIFIISALLIAPQISEADNLSGSIFLQVEENGEAWYIYPEDNRAYYLGKPADAFEIMKKLALGAKHDFITETKIFPSRLAGRILLDVEDSGRAYYIHPSRLTKHYLGKPADAFALMRSLGRGISNRDLEKISKGTINQVSQKEEIKEKNNKTGLIFIDNVPFTTQAPFGNWSDSRQQDGCEEASALMAMSWVHKQGLSKEKALSEILAISDYLKKEYGEYRDISAADALTWIFNDYFKYDKVSLLKGITKENIIAELEKGQLIIAPMDGQALQNPNFTPPGPPRHMLLIRGYDASNKEFITNDPGTRKGELYRYNEDILYGAIRDYPTGYHEKIDNIEKNIIVISR